MWLYVNVDVVISNMYTIITMVVMVQPRVVGRVVVGSGSGSGSGSSVSDDGRGRSLHFWDEDDFRGVGKEKLKQPRQPSKSSFCPFLAESGMTLCVSVCGSSGKCSRAFGWLRWLGWFDDAETPLQLLDAHNINRTRTCKVIIITPQ